MNQDNNSNNFNGMGNGFNNQMPNPNDGLGSQAMQNNNDLITSRAIIKIINKINLTIFKVIMEYKIMDLTV